VLRLSLSHNNIVRIDSAAFMNLQNLTELDLSHNFITSENLASDVFKVKQPVQNKFLCLNSAAHF
jgi:Leucine-rich repeat (LRR) protein